MGRVRAAVATVAVLAALLTACSDEPDPRYDATFQADFERACQAGMGGGSATGACRCWYERLSTEIPFDELPAVDDLTASFADEDTVDPQLYEWLADCSRTFGAAGDVPVTAPPPVTVPRPTTTTTTLPIAQG